MGLFFCRILVIAILSVCFRLTYLVYTIKRNRKNIPTLKSSSNDETVKCMMVLGSGGHTAELLRLLSALNMKVYHPRHYVIASTDKISAEKVVSLEGNLNPDQSAEYEIFFIPRSREVKQSWTSSVFSTIYASLYSFPLVLKSRPKLLLVNGPGTCIPVCVAAFFLTVIGHKVTIVFVESICRVTTMSLSGKILYYFADHLIVQWPELHKLYPETRYMGRIV